MSITEIPPGRPPSVDVLTLDNDDLRTHICSFASRIAAATCVFLLAVAEYDRREAWAAWECRSMAHWLSWHCEVDLVTASRYCRTATALTRLPLVQARFAAGELSYSQVRAIAKVATPDNEEMLVEWARAMTASQLEKVTSTYRRCRAQAEQTAEERDRRRTLTWGYDDDGSITGVFRLAPEEGEILIKAISERTAGFDPTRDPSNQDLDPGGARRADALIELAADDLDRRAADQTADPGDRHLVTIIAEASVLRPDPDEADIVDVCAVDADARDEGPVTAAPQADAARMDGTETASGIDGAMGHPPASGMAGRDVQPEADGHSASDDQTDARDEEYDASEPQGDGPADELCQIAGGPGLAPSTVRRLLCDQPSVLIVRDREGNILNVGRRTRRINRALRRALNQRDGGCQFAGCGATRTHAHHIVHWIDGGHTHLENLISLCSFHHHRLHQGGFIIELARDGSPVFVFPNGRRITKTIRPLIPPVPESGGLAALSPADACMPEWDGSHPDLDIMMHCLFQADGLLEDPAERLVDSRQVVLPASELRERGLAESEIREEDFPPVVIPDDDEDDPHD
jgi:Domain of unknown function (DUF222)/HNH endonuclease